MTHTVHDTFSQPIEDHNSCQVIIVKDSIAISVWGMSVSCWSDSESVFGNMLIFLLACYNLMWLILFKLTLGGSA